jgi:hypothetical protein
VEYTLSGSISYRIAIPSPVSPGTPYDLVLQVVAPNDVGWAGISWGGSMLASPLTVAWANYGNGVTVSSRYTR